ncbi:MAG: hypothetical protein H7263_13970 [Candidatus Sericytochromatia bacterium]|nr:hypothetical protein [Candidatus Sericytochromatia bacterium]
MNNEIIEWKNKLELINKNLMELTNSDFVKNIRNHITGLNSITYTGKTYLYGKNSIELLDRLWKNYALMNETVQQAEDLYKKQGIFKDNSQEINNLLHGSTISIIKNDISLEKRDLIYNSQISLTLDEAQILMVSQFSEVRDSFILLRDVEKSVEISVNLIKKEYDELNQLQIVIGKKVNIEVFEHIDTFKNNPLLVMESLPSAKKNLSIVREKLEKINNLKFNIKEKLENIRRKLEELKSLIDKQNIVTEETQKTFSNSSAFLISVNENLILSYENWIKYLNDSFINTSIPLNSLSVGVEKCLEVILVSIKNEEANYKKNCEKLNELEDLKGRFRAYYAKYEIMRLNTSETLKLIEVIKTALYCKPIDLSVASKLVRKFEMILSN